MAKYYPDIAKGAKGNRFHPFYYIILYRVLSFLCKQKRDLSSSREDLLDVVSHRSFSHPFSSKTQIYSPALCPTKTNSPWTRNQSPAGYVFYLCLSFLEVDVSSDLERETRLSLRSNHHRTRDRKIERFLLRCLSVEKALMRKNEQNEHFLTRALFLSLSTCDKHTHTHIKI